MTSVLTLTMNPALDVWTRTPRVTDTHKLRCESPREHPGGGGVNVARVIHRLGGEVLALYAAGGPTGERLQHLIEAEQVPAAPLHISGETRESFTVAESTTGREYRFVLPGPQLTSTEWQHCLDEAALAGERRPYVIASGSLPPGVPQDFYARLARRVRGSRIVVDSSGPALAEALKEGVFLAKPSLRELRELTSLPLSTEAEQAAAAMRLVEDGRAQLLALSLGEGGALLIALGFAVAAAGLAVPVTGTIGAGDSFLAGLVWGLAHGEAPAEALRRAMAAGAAALATEGTQLCDPGEVERLLPQVQLRELMAS